MRITIEGHPSIKYTPKWETLESLLREIFADEGQLVRIYRTDGKCDYREVGIYELGYKNGPTILPITLEVKRSGYFPNFT